MTQSALYNLTGRAIPEDAKIAISGEQQPGDVLVIESLDGTSGSAIWRSDAELKIQLAKRPKASSKPDASPPWSPPLKPRAPYS
jgi:hypothetical protein